MFFADALLPFAASSHAEPPARLGQRYSATQFLPEAGNTVVCHLDVTDPAHGAVIEARARMRALPEADRFLATPVQSLHMTVFEGIIETRRAQDAWPRDLDRAASVDSVTQALMARFADFRAPPAFSVRVADLRPTGFVLQGATPEDVACMTAWRAALTAPFGFRNRNHDDYGFHMTIAYPVAWLSDEVLPVWEAEFRSILEFLAEAAPVIPLRPPAFCQFADMTHFEELVVLGG